MSEEQKKAFLASGSLISMTQAAELTPYTAEYLSLLARRGKLKAVKISRDWLTTQQEISLYLKKQQEKHKKILFNLEAFEKETV